MLRRLDYIWRLLGTGLAFALFGIGGLLMTLTLFPLVAIFSFDEAKRSARTQGLIHGAFRLFVAMLINLRVIEFDSVGREQLQRCRGNIIVANHPSLLDVVLLMSLMPKAQCVVKHQLWENKFLGGVVRAAGYIRNDSDPNKMISQCVEVLRNGENIVLFPEGTRTIPGQPIKFQRGFANIATMAEADLQMVTITCSPTTLTKGEHWYQIPNQRAKFTITTDNQLDIKEYMRHEPRTVAVRKLTRDLEQYYTGKLSYG